MKKKILYLAFVLFINHSLFIINCFAQEYGEGTYNSGNYNEGQPTSTPVSIRDNSPSNNSQPPAPATCTADKPSTSPDLFQIDTNFNSATLYFVPARSPLTYYYISFGTNPKKLEYGTQFNSQTYSGVQKVTINALKPNTKYYFQIRGGNDCMPGDWSGVVIARTTASPKSLKRIYYASSQLISESKTIIQIPKRPITVTKKETTNSVTSDKPSAEIKTAPESSSPELTTSTKPSKPSLLSQLKSFIFGLFHKK